jgi:hypothetical protein
MTGSLRVDYKSKHWILQVYHQSTCAVQIVNFIIIMKLLSKCCPINGDLTVMTFTRDARSKKNINPQ